MQTGNVRSFDDLAARGTPRALQPSLLCATPLRLPTCNRHSCQRRQADIWDCVELVVRPEHPTAALFVHGHCMGAAHVLRMLQLGAHNKPPPTRPSPSSGPSPGPSAQAPAGFGNTQPLRPAASPSSASAAAASLPMPLAGVLLTAPSFLVPPANKPSCLLMKALRCLASVAPAVTVADWPVVMRAPWVRRGPA